MLEVLTAAWTTLLRSSPWELLAMILSIFYLVLATKENIWCWPAAFIATLIYLVMFFKGRLMLESLLQVFYLAMAAYGWHEWHHRKKDKSGRAISVWSLKRHIIVICATGTATIVAGLIFASYTKAALPYLDAFTTCFAIVATFMVPWKILENWIYWLAIDTASIYLYISREFYLTALLFCVYIVLIIFGYCRWLSEYRSARQHT